MKQPYKFHDNELNLTLVELNLTDNQEITEDSLNDLMATLALVLDPAESDGTTLNFDKSKYLQ